MANFFKPTTKKTSSGQVITVEIDRLDSNGCGVGKYQNKPIFIENTLPNEKVKAKVFEAKGKYYKAKVIELLDKNNSRVTPQCKHFKTCGGCDLQHLTIQEHFPFKQKKVSDLFARQQITSALPWQDPIESDTWYYRRKARIGVQYNKHGDAIVGFRQRQSNTLIKIKHCSVLVDPLSDIFLDIDAVAQTLTLPKSIGHIEVIATQIVTLVIRQLLPLNDHDKQLWLNKAEELQWQIYIDDGKSLSALTPVSPLFYQLTYKSDADDSRNLDYDVTIAFEPKDFIQINHYVNKRMIVQALQWLDLSYEDNVLDLFCGLGNFSLPIAQQVQRVIGVEGMQSMVDKATYNAKINNINNTEFYQADLNNDWKNLPWAEQSYSKVLLDPARAGAYEAVAQLVKLNISTIVYVSCDPATLAKDSQLLISSGYKVQKISIMDMFVHTKHIETMVLFKKV